MIREERAENARLQARVEELETEREEHQQYAQNYKALAERRGEALAEAVLATAARWLVQALWLGTSSEDVTEKDRAEREARKVLASTSPAAAALLAQGEEARKIVAILKANGMNLGVVQVPPVIQDPDRLFALKDAVAAFDGAALAPEEETK